MVAIILHAIRMLILDIFLIEDNLTAKIFIVYHEPSL